MYNYFSNDIVFAEKSLLNETTSNTGYYPETRTDFHIFYENPGCVSVAARISGGVSN